MQKKLSYLMSVILFFGLHFSSYADVIELNRENIFLGKLPQAYQVPAQHEIEVRRSYATPSEVNLLVQFEEWNRVCIEEGYRRVWVPGWCQDRCWRGPDGRTYCRRECQPGYYRTEPYCIRYDLVSSIKQEKIELDFSEAQELNQGKTETFRIHLTQKEISSSDFYLAGEYIETQVPYRIRQKSRFGNTKNTLLFEVQD